MDTERWGLAGDIFEKLLGVPAADRELLLGTLCGGDAELRSAVISLLDSQEYPRSGGDASATKQVAATSPEAIRTPAHDVGSVDSRVGPWRLVRRLGEGGMGVVWLAERADGQFRQRAALKLIKRGMDSEAVLARFLRERQILARLEHANIGRLLDGGIAEDGRPYFAMEYIDGMPILDYCRLQECRLEQRLTLFREVCAAVEFAHSQHVVHRDIKPSNVLVTAQRQVKLLDFGIAKLLAEDDGYGATLTQAGRGQPLTPAYAAPEQIEGASISAATDVYALGGLLYELLTNRPAHDFSSAADAQGVLRIIQSTAPVAPSRLRPERAPVPGRYLRGDLDTIALTALHADPARRYASVAALVADLDNYRSGKPISARRDHVLYRAYKYAKRHRGGIGAASALFAIVALALLVVAERRVHDVSGTALAIVDLDNLAHERSVDWIAPALTQMFATELAQGSRINALPDDLVRNARVDLPVPLAGGYTESNLAVLKKRLGADLVLSGSYLVSGSGSEAKLRFDLALQDVRSGAMRARVERSGALTDLLVLVEEAGNDLRMQLGLTAVSAESKHQVNRALPPNADVARHIGIAIDALRRYDPARAKQELLDALNVAPSYALAHLYLAQAWKQMGYDAKALASAKQAMAASTDLPAEWRLRIERELAWLQADWKKAVEIDRGLVAQSPDNAELRFDLIDSLIAAGKPDQAQAVLAELRKLSVAAEDARVELKAARLANIRGDRAAQAQFAETALRLAQARSDTAHAAEAKRMLADARDLQGRRDEAEMLTRQAIADFQRLGNPHAEAEAYWLLALIHGEAGREKDQHDEFQRALEIYQRIGDQHGIANMHSNLGWVLWKHGDYEGAENAYKRALAIAREIGDLRGQARMLADLANLMLEQSASDEAVAKLREAMQIANDGGQKVQYLDVLSIYVSATRLRGELTQSQAACVQLHQAMQGTDNPLVIKTGEFECALTALESGDLVAARAGLERAKAAATTTNSTTLGLVEMQQARIDVANGLWTSARDHLARAVEKFKADERPGDEAVAQAQFALVNLELGNDEERDHAAARAKDLISQITSPRPILMANIALAELQGEMGKADAALTTLHSLADDADARYWFVDALEARHAALRLYQRNSRKEAEAARHELEAAARQHGFNWLLTRMTAPITIQ